MGQFPHGRRLYNYTLGLGVCLAVIAPWALFINDSTWCLSLIMGYLDVEAK